jgi:hypothetical protein
MNLIGSLKLVATSRPTSQAPIVGKRNKVIDRLHDQLELVTAQLSGRPHFKQTIRRIKNAETGVFNDIPQQRTVKPWFWTGQKGEVLFQVRYGNKVIELKKGNPTIEIEMLTMLPDVIEALKNAIVAGELDAQIEAASSSVKKRFDKPAKR